MDSCLSRNSSKFKLTISYILGFIFTFKMRKILFLEHVLKKFRKQLISVAVHFPLLTFLHGISQSLQFYSADRHVYLFSTIAPTPVQSQPGNNLSIKI